MSCSGTGNMDWICGIYLGDFLSVLLPVYATSDVGDFRYVRCYVCLVCWFLGRLSTVRLCKGLLLKDLEVESVFSLLFFWEGRHGRFCELIDY